MISAKQGYRIVYSRTVPVTWMTASYRLSKLICGRLQNGHRNLFLLFINALLSILIACGETVSDGDVENLGTQLFSTLQNKEFKKCMDYYAADFFASRSVEHWQNELSNLQLEFGNIVQFRLIKKQSDTRFSGKFYIYQYYVEHVHGRVWHTLTFQNPTNSNDLLFVGHKIEKKGNNIDG